MQRSKISALRLGRGEHLNARTLYGQSITMEHMCRTYRPSDTFSHRTPAEMFRTYTSLIENTCVDACVIDYATAKSIVTARILLLSPTTENIHMLLSLEWWGGFCNQDMYPNPIGVGIRGLEVKVEVGQHNIRHLCDLFRTEHHTTTGSGSNLGADVWINRFRAHYSDYRVASAGPHCRMDTALILCGHQRSHSVDSVYVFHEAYDCVATFSGASIKTTLASSETSPYRGGTFYAYFEHLLCDMLGEHTRLPSKNACCESRHSRPPSQGDGRIMLATAVNPFIARLHALWLEKTVVRDAPSGYDRLVESIVAAAERSSPRH